MQTNSSKMLSLYQEQENGHLKDFFQLNHTHTRIFSGFQGSNVQITKDISKAFEINKKDSPWLKAGL